jgi:pimeloyl-ACP methyl ester carboxylesterase
MKCWVIGPFHRFCCLTRSLTLATAFSGAIGTDMPRERLERLDSERFLDAEHFATRQVETARALGNPAYFDEAAIRAAGLAAFGRGVPQCSIARHFMMGLAVPDLRDRLAVLGMPVQVIHGRADKVIALSLAQETAAAIPGARLTILDDMAHEGPPQLWDGSICSWPTPIGRNAPDQTMANT